MQHGKHIAMAVGALLCTVLLVLPLGIGQTQARYENTVSWKGVYDAATPTLKSNFLAEGGRTVLLKDWVVSTTSYQTVGIQLATDGAESSGTLHCQVASDLLTAKVDEETYRVGNTKNYATMTLTATEQARSLTEPTEVTVRVSWLPEGKDLAQATQWADFKVKLLPQAANDPATPPDGVRPEGELKLDCPQSFSLQEKLVLRLTLPQDADSVVLSYEADVFPENTCYQVDQGQSIVLAEDMMITIPTAGRREIKVVLDFSWTTVKQGSFFLSAAACAGTQEFTAKNVTVSTSRQALEVETDSAAIILGAYDQVKLPIYGDPDGFVWKLEQLVQQDGKIRYAASDALKLQTETGNTDDGTENFMLMITNEYTRAPAGKYRLTLQRVYDGVVLSSVEITVFVCY